MQVRVSVARCTKCGSTNCFPTWYTSGSVMCIPCGHEFDMRGTLWQRVKAVIAALTTKGGADG